MMLAALVVAMTGAAGAVSVACAGLGSAGARRGAVGLVSVLAILAGIGLAAYAANFTGNLGRKDAAMHVIDDVERRLVPVAQFWLPHDHRPPAVRRDARPTPEEARRGFAVPAEAIGTFLDGLEERYGGIEGYLGSLGLGEDVFAAIRRNLVDAG